MADMATRIAAAAGDAAALLSIAIELAQENAALVQLRDADEERRAGQRERSRRHRNVTPRDVTSQNVTERDGVLPPPPSVSLLSPTPPNNPSTPPTPTSSSSAAGALEAQETADEQDFYRDIASPVFVRVAQRFLAGKSTTARIAWIGRFRGAMARPPHPTAAELGDALEDLMANEPPENWAPTLFRTYVGRIRRDKAREAERDAAQRNGTGHGAPKSSPVADACWQATLALIPKWHARQVTSETFDAMTPGQRAALSAIGGFQTLVETKADRRVWLKKDFVAAFNAAPREAKSA